ncbi:MAG: hypothetical protein KF878_07075 [Planctomycetes bacterium]|nr:hypothetical protein [Planctomycetota bacterium]
MAVAEEALAAAPLDPDAWGVRARSLAAAGRIDEAGRALEDLAARARLPWVEPLRAHVAAARGDDPRPVLEAAAASWPDDVGVVTALVVHLLEAGAAPVALARLRS